MKKAIIIALFMGLRVSVWWYLWVLLRRTGFLAHGISIANDSIHIMYLACGALVLTAGYAAFRRVVWPALDGQCISLFDKNYELVSLVYDALTGLGL